jgi:sucrose-6-phosphate hydrolase SacC (GH32 family)
MRKSKSNIQFFISIFSVLYLLHFNSNAQMPAMDTSRIKMSDVEISRRLRRADLNDPIRSSWHLTIPEGIGYPFDPNGAFFKDGVYHMMCLYQADEGRWHWQHFSSIDLFHWRWYPNDLKPNPNDPERGISSGNAFIDKDGRVVFAYHGAGTEGTCVAKSDNNNFSAFTKSKANPIVITGWADPHMWLENGTYYLLSGSKQVIGDNPPMLYSGDAYDQPMKKIGKFMTHNMPGINDFEDVSCPDFFKLGDKWVLVCISHACGARYYIGTWDGKQFNPESHNRMNWPGGTMFAPETLLDDKGRRILWAWVLDRKSGISSGTMSMPRVLTLAKDKLSLNIEPPREIEELRYSLIGEKPFAVAAGQSVTLNNVMGNSLEIDITIDPGKAKRFGLKVFCSQDGREQTPIVIDRVKNILQIDMRPSSLNKPVYYEFCMPALIPLPRINSIIQTQDAPFTLKNREKVHLRLFLDKSMLEVFANDRQCITQVIYPTLKDAVNVQVFAEDAPIKVKGISAWKLFPSMQW